MQVPSACLCQRRNKNGQLIYHKDEINCGNEEKSLEKVVSACHYKAQCKVDYLFDFEKSSLIKCHLRFTKSTLPSYNNIVYSAMLSWS